LKPNIPTTRIVTAVRNRPRFRAKMLRELMVYLAGEPGGMTLEDAGAEFAVYYNMTPTRNLLSQQAALLVRDKRIERTGWGAYKLVRYEMPTLAAAAPAPALATA
jgi:hypothetical protein